MIISRFIFLFEGLSRIGLRMLIFNKHIICLMVHCCSIPFEHSVLKTPF